MINFKDKRVLVAGGTGMVGRYLVDQLIEKEAGKIFVASMDRNYKESKNVIHIFDDLTVEQACMNLLEDTHPHIIFNLLGVKTSPKVMGTRPADVFELYLKLTRFTEAVFMGQPEFYVHTSSIGVYGTEDLSIGAEENSLWWNTPSSNDWFGGWGKRIGEMQIEAYRMQYGWNNAAIIRPANIYGRYDDFSENAMVIPSLIKKLVNKENPFIAWGDGSPIRDFIHAEDVARAMIMTVEKECNMELNVGSGRGVSILELIGTLRQIADYDPDIQWDEEKPNGDMMRLLNTDLIKEQIGWAPQVSLRNGLKDTYEWYKDHQEEYKNRYTIFK